MASDRKSTRFPTPCCPSCDNVLVAHYTCYTSNLTKCYYAPGGPFAICRHCKQDTGIPSRNIPWSRSQAARLLGTTDHRMAQFISRTPRHREFKFSKVTATDLRPVMGMGAQRASKVACDSAQALRVGDKTFPAFTEADDDPPAFPRRSRRLPR